jgi:hypothetical protein
MGADVFTLRRVFIFGENLRARSESVEAERHVSATRNASAMLRARDVHTDQERKWIVGRNRPNGAP